MKQKDGYKMRRRTYGLTKARAAEISKRTRLIYIMKYGDKSNDKSTKQ